MYPYALFTLFGNGVHLYGICIAVGLLTCILVYFLYTRKKGMDKSVQEFGFYVAIGAIALGFLFAKLYQAIYDWIEKGTFNFASAGITAMGGFVGGAVVFVLLYFVVGHFIYKSKDNIHLKEFNKIALVAPCCITVAHAFGRIGCLTAGCCHGAYLGQEYVFGGIWMRASDTGVWGYYVPTQLYECLFLFALFAVLTILFMKNCNITHAIYLIAYGVWRMFIEFFRTDAAGAVVLGLRPSQWQSIIFIIGGIALIVIFIIKKIPLFIKPKPSENENG